MNEKLCSKVPVLPELQLPDHFPGLHVPEGGQDAGAVRGVLHLLQCRLLAAELGQSDWNITVRVAWKHI